MTAQATWKYIANLGDATPLSYGGRFVYVDETGVYPPELEWLEPPSDDIDEDDAKATWTVYRFILEPCTYVNDVLSDNKFHPDYPVWFAKDLDALASSMGMELDELVEAFTSDDACKRAFAWMAVADYWGVAELDQYPECFSKAEIEARYTDGELNR